MASGNSFFMRRWLRRLAATGISGTIVASALFVGTIAPASADTLMERCQQGQVADSEVTLTHWVRTSGVSYPATADPPNVLGPGDVVAVSISRNTVNTGFGQSYGPEGKPERAPVGFPVPGFEQVQLDREVQQQPRRMGRRVDTYHRPCYLPRRARHPGTAALWDQRRQHRRQ
jgi:hypothetical protein